MPQRLTSARQINYAPEITEGTDPGTQGNYSALAVSNLMVGPENVFYSRPIKGEMGSIAGKIGAQLAPWLSFTCSLRGGGSVGVAPEVHELLKCVLSPPVDNRSYSTTLTSVSGTTVTVASTTGLTKGTAVGIDKQNPNGTYEVGWVQDVPNGTQFVLTDAMVNQTWNSGASVIGSYTYNPQNTGHSSLSFRIYLDSSGSNNYIAFSGCKGTVKIDMPAPGVAAKATFRFQAMSYTFGSSTVPAPNFSSVTPPVPYQFKMGGTATSIKLASCSLGQSVARKMSQTSTTGTFAQVVADRRVRGTIHAYDVDNSQFTNWSAGQTIALAHQIGTAQHNVVAYQIPYGQRARVAYGDEKDNTTDLVAFTGNISAGADDVRVAFI